MGQTIVTDAFGWVVAQIESLTPDNPAYAGDTFQYVPGILQPGARRFKDMRCFDFVIEDGTQQPYTHGTVNPGPQNYAVTLALGMVYTTPKGLTGQVNIIIFEDMTRILRSLTDESQWGTQGDNPRGEIKSVQAELVGLSANLTEKGDLHSVHALYSITVEFHRKSWS